MVGVNRHMYTYIGKPHLMKAQRGKCFYCGKFMSSAAATRDHLYPRAMGRTSLVLNQVICCRKCNLRKGCRPPTARELAKARGVYASLGAPAFAI